MKISPINSYSPQNAGEAQRTSTKNSNVSFGYIREDKETKAAMKNLGVSYWFGYSSEYDIHGLDVWAENGKSKFKINFKPEEREERRAEIEALEKETERFNGIIKNKEVIAAIVKVIKAIFPPPEGEKPDYGYKSDDRFWY